MANQFSDDYLIPRPELYDFYYNKKHSIKTIAQHYNCSYWVIYNRMKRYGYKPRSCNEMTIIKRGFLKDIEITPYIRQILDGIMISDGYYTKYGCNRTAKFVLNQSIKHESWINAIYNILTTNGFKVKIYHGNPILNETIFPQKILKTSEYISLKNERKRWYPNGKKIIPDDLNIDPIFLANWFMGDGCCTIINKTKIRTYYKLFFCTDSFKKLSIQKLCHKINKKYNWHFRLKKYRNTYRIYNSKQKEIQDFLYKTYPYHSTCFNYKWDALNKFDFTNFRDIKT